MATEWIKATERLPEFPAGEDSVTCAVFCVAGVLAMEWHRNRYAATEKGRQPRWEWHHRISPWDITHWMPLPEPPTV